MVTTTELSERVERLALSDRRLWSIDGLDFRLRDVVFFEAKGGVTFAWLEGHGEKGLKVSEDISVLGRLGKDLFVRCHRNFLVAVGRVLEVAERYPEDPGEPDEVPRKRPDGWRTAADECELRLEGTPRRVPVTTTFAKGVKKALGLSSLHYLVPEHPDDKKLRNMGIIDLAWRDLYKLDPKDQAAVDAYIAEWQIVRFGVERTLKFFRQAGASVVDKRRLAKNIIWQNWRWIKKGIQKPFKGNIRTFWYEVKNALGGDEILAPDDVSIFYDSLRELIEDRRMFRYKDFGFMDMKKIFHEVGAKRPDIVLVMEKGGQLAEARELAGEVGSSFICLGGEPSLLTLEYFSDDLRAAIGDRELSVFVMTDINPAGVSIRNSFLDGMTKQGLKIGRTSVLWEAKDIPDAVLPGGKAWVARYELKGSKIIPIKPSSMSQITKALRWFEALGDPRLKTQQEYPGGKLVVTIWGVDSDAANKDLVRRRFLEGVALVPRRKRL